MIYSRSPLYYQSLDATYFAKTLRRGILPNEFLRLRVRPDPPIWRLGRWFAHVRISIPAVGRPGAGSPDSIERIRPSLSSARRNLRAVRTL